MERVNILMASYQGEKYLAEQLDSILQSEDADFVITIYDDGSKDRTKEIASLYEERYPGKVHLVSNKSNLGHLKNFMQGVLNNPYSYVMFCDQDDVWKPDKIKKTYECMKQAEAQNPEQPLVVFTDALIVDGNLKPRNPSYHKSQGLDTGKLDFAHMLMENKMMGCTMMLNRAVIEKVKCMPEHARFHDWWIGLIASAFGKIVYLPEPTMLYRQHENNVVGNQSFGSYISNRLKNLGRQREALRQTIGQAEEFLQLYGDELPEDKLRLLQKMVELRSAGFFKRRYLIIRYGFLKSGITRNLGLLFLI